MLTKKDDVSSVNVIVILFQGSMLSLYAKGVINDAYQHFKAKNASVKGHHGVGGKSKYFFSMIF